MPRAKKPARKAPARRTPKRPSTPPRNPDGTFRKRAAPKSAKPKALPRRRNVDGYWDARRKVFRPIAYSHGYDGGRLAKPGDWRNMDSMAQAVHYDPKGEYTSAGMRNAVERMARHEKATRHRRAQSRDPGMVAQRDAKRAEMRDRFKKDWRD